MKKSSLILLTIFIFISCSDSKKIHNDFETVSIIEIPLEGNTSSRNSEISGLTWYQNKLILLPQYPHLFGENNDGKIFSIDKKKLLDYVNNINADKITPEEISFRAGGLEQFNKWGSGYEAIAFKGDTVYLTIESYESETTNGYVVSGIFNQKENIVELDSSTLQKIPSQSKIENFSDETILIWKNKVITLHELNNKRLINQPVANSFDLQLNRLRNIEFPNIEFRITDATAVKEDSSFWVINYFYPGEEISGNLADDKISELDGTRKFLQKGNAIERLLKMQISGNSISLTDTRPIYLDITGYPEGKNWEGIVKLDSLGFLLATDKFPKTILAFVPFKLN